MDPSSSVPLHFSLEFFGLAVSGGLLAWAAHARRRVAAPAAVLLIAQAAHLMSVSGDTPGMVAAVAAVAAAATGFRLPQRVLWFIGWTAVVAGGVALAAADPHTGDRVVTGGQVWLHVLQFAGFVVLGLWAWRQALASVRLRLLGAFGLVLIVVVTVAGGSVVRVVAVNLENEELGRLAVQTTAQVSALGEILGDLGRRSADVSSAFSRDILNGAPPEQTARQRREATYTDLARRGFVAFVQQASVVGAGIGETDIAFSSVPTVVQAIGGTGGTAFLLAGDELVLLGASPVYRGAVQTPENVVGAAVLGLRLGAAEMEEIARRTERHAAIVSRSGRLVAKDPRLALDSLPPAALEELIAGRSWSGSVEARRERVLAVVSPLVSGNATVAAIIRAADDEALIETTNNVSRALTGAVLAAALIAILIALWFGSRLARPIIALTAIARRVEEGDLEATSDVRSSDEVGVLASAFDGMTASLRETIAAEQETRMQLETIVGGMGEGLAAVDGDYNIVSFNPAAEAITGVSADDAIGRKCYEVYGELTAGPDGKPICDYMCPIRHGGGKDGEVAIRSADGPVLTLAVTSSTLRDDEGEVIGGVDLLRDVTPEIQAERMKSTIISRTAHELRTPLVPIKGYAQMMLRNEVPRENAIKYLREINEGTERLERIATILVDIAEMQAGHLKAKPEETRAEAIVRQAADRCRERGIGNIRTSVAKGLPDVPADVSLVGRAMDELIANAVQFSPEGAQIDLAAKKVPRGVEFSVKDRGVGIPAEDVEGIFDEFAQADPDKPVKGLGMGLSFVRGVVEAHGGEVQVVSRPKRGSTFSFVLPVAAKPKRKR